MSYDSGEIKPLGEGLSLSPAYFAKRIRVEDADQSALTDGGGLVGAVVAPQLRELVIPLRIS